MTPNNVWNVEWPDAAGTGDLLVFHNQPQELGVATLTASWTQAVASLKALYRQPEFIRTFAGNHQLPPIAAVMVLENMVPKPNAPNPLDEEYVDAPDWLLDIFFYEGWRAQMVEQRGGRTFKHLIRWPNCPRPKVAPMGDGHLRVGGSLTAHHQGGDVMLLRVTATCIWARPPNP